MKTPFDDLRGEVLYENAWDTEASVTDWKLEGDAHLTFPEGKLRMENARDASEGQAANFVLWCPQKFPDRITATWEFQPLREPGLCIVFFAARGHNGKDLFDLTLAERDGQYRKYHSGEIDALHASYFRRKNPDERQFHTCNLRKSHGFHLVAMGADPIPDADEAVEPYRISFLKDGPLVRFAVNDLEVFRWKDDETHGPILTEGYMGFRQMAPLIGEYGKLVVYGLK